MNAKSKSLAYLVVSLFIVFLGILFLILYVPQTSRPAPSASGGSYVSTPLRGDGRHFSAEGILSLNDWAKSGDSFCAGGSQYFTLTDYSNVTYLVSYSDGLLNYTNATVVVSGKTRRFRMDCSGSDLQCTGAVCEVVDVTSVKTAEADHCVKGNEEIPPQPPSRWGVNYSEFCCKGLTPASPYLWVDGRCESLVGGPHMACIGCGDGVCENTIWENLCTCKNDCWEEPKECASKGDAVSESPNLNDWLPDECCIGLRPIYGKKSYADGGCAAYTLPRGMICYTCGDGRCDSVYESGCNCPSDC